MSAKDRAGIETERRLPALTLTSLPDGKPCRLRPGGRRNPVLVLVHGPRCEACSAYLGQLAAQADAIREWDGFPIIICSGGPRGGGASEEPGGPAMLADPEERVATALALRPPAVAIADQWGEVYLARNAGEDHLFPEVSEMVGWLRYLAIQCPECQGEAF